VEALHLFALSGFAFAQPLFDILGRNSTFFVAHGMGPTSVILFALALIILPPAVLIAMIGIVRLISRRLARFLHVVCVGLLVALAALPYVNRTRAPLVITLLVLTVLSIGTAIAYVNVRAVGRYVSILAIAPLVVALLFLTSGSVRALLRPVASGAPTERGDDDRAPVVMLVMDEFPQGAFLRPDGSIDDDRFPNIGRLAERSTWYPNATTNSNATQNALPSMLTGRFPQAGNPPPTQAVFPENLFTLIPSTHRPAIDEWLTALCPVDVCRDRSIAYEDTKHVLADTTLIYLHVVLPKRLARELPPLGLQWAGFLADPAAKEQRLRRAPGPLKPIARAVLDPLTDETFRTYQSRRFERFLRSIRSTQDPRFWFLHLGLPHQPWHLLPDGRPYDPHDTPGLETNRSSWQSVRGAIGGLQRFEMQAKATDGLIGKLIDRLDDQRLWDDALVIVLADHGITFRPPHTTRAVIGVEGDLLPVPLFVKYPQQRHSDVDRRNAETVDVVPTIADVVDVRIPWRVDGSSLAGPDPKRRVKRVWPFGNAVRTYDPDISDERTNISKIIRTLFGKATKHDDLFGFGPHRKLVGRALDDLTIGRAPAGTTVTLHDPERWARLDNDAPFVAARPTGRITGSHEIPWIAVAVNGMVAGLGQPWRSDGAWAFSIMVSDRHLTPGRNELELFSVDDDGRLERIPYRK
jgi:arylsulfatase A-like enzyme